MKNVFKRILPVISFGLLGFAGLACAADVVTVQVPNLVPSLMDLFGAFKDKASVAVIIVAVVQVLKTNEVVGILGKVASKYLPIIVAVVSVLGFTATAVVSGKSWIQGVLEGLATAISSNLFYDAFRSLKAKEEVPAVVASAKVKASKGMNA